MDDPVRLTQYSRGAGCGCKIAPGMLEKILSLGGTAGPGPQLLVGNNSRDDAAVFDLGNGQAIISTTDFFMPIVDDPFEFGEIASVNAISDVYAMGGEPLMAVAALGWPLDKLPAEVAARVLEGGVQPVPGPVFLLLVAIASTRPSQCLDLLSPARFQLRI